MIKISKKPKFTTRRGNNKKEFKKDIRNWILITPIYIFLVMVLYGTSKSYYPDPIPIGYGLYMDFAVGIIYGGIAIWSIITFLIFQTKL